MITETVREREMEWEEEKHKGNPFFKERGYLSITPEQEDRKNE